MKGDAVVRQLHAEVAGGGVAGLAVGTMLRMRGWSVRLHEQDDEIREVGGGFYLRPNHMRVLDVLGVGSEIRRVGVFLERASYRDGVTGAVHQVHSSGPEKNLWICTRQALIQALERRARDAGVEIVLGSKVLGADPIGLLRTSQGDFSADLVVGADGVGSPVRESLGLAKEWRRLPTLATRYLAPTRDLETEPQTTMWWSGSRRIGIAPCSAAETYIYMICPEDDAEGAAIPMNLSSWVASFPMLANELATIHELPAIQHNYTIVRCRRWHSGRVAIIGDAAHGLPPLLGQGAGLALSNANSLAASVSSDPNQIPDDLDNWEREFRRFADRTQFWSMHLDSVTNNWPRPLFFLRRPYLWFLGRSPIQRKMRMADDYPIRDLSGMSAARNS